MNASQRHIFISSFPCVPDRTCVLPFIWRWKATLNWICKCTLLLLLNWTRSVRKFRKQKEQHGLMFFLSLNAHSRSYELQECVRERQHILQNHNENTSGWTGTEPGPSNSQPPVHSDQLHNLEHLRAWARPTTKNLPAPTSSTQSTITAQTQQIQ